MLKKVFILLMSMLLLTALPAACLAVTHVVTTSGELVAAIGAAVEGDVIEIVPGTYQWAQGVAIDVGLTVRGQSGDPADVIIRLDYLTEGIVDLEGFQGEHVLRFEGLTFSQYDAEPILMSINSDLELVRCVFTECTPTYGLVVSNAGLLCQDCLFQSIQSTAIITGSGATVITDSRFQGNTITFAAVDMEHGSLDMTGCSLTGNTGRLVYTAPMDVSLDRCLVQNNGEAQDAIYLSSMCQLDMNDCSIRDNVYFDGGLYLGPTSVANLTQCDIRNNGAYDGRILLSQVVFICCDVDITDWFVQNSVYTFENDGCGVATAPVTLDGLKARYRN